MNGKTVKIKGTIYWAFLNKMNTYGDKPQYQVDIGDLSPAAVKALESIGIEPKHKDNMGFHITCKSKYPIVAYDAHGNVIDLDITPVGNGSKCLAVIDSYKWEYMKRKGVSPCIAKGGLKITELVEYHPEPVADLTEEEAL